MFEHVIEHLYDRGMLEALLYIGFVKEECVQVPSSALKTLKIRHFEAVVAKGNQQIKKTQERRVLCKCY